MDSYYTLDESLLTLLNINELTGYKVINLYSFFCHLNDVFSLHKSAIL